MRAFFKNKSDLGKLMILIGLITLVPIIIIPFFINEAKYFLAFFLPAVSSVILGFAFCLFIKNKPSDENYYYIVKSGSLTVLFTWIYGIFMGAVPFLFLGKLNFLHCLFESACGWTTSGFTVINVYSVPRIFIFHRSFMQFCGGLGIILMMAMIIQNKHSLNLYNLEGHNDRLSPKVLNTARMIFYLYSGVFVAGVILYIICGMPVFDSFIHCMSALSTGGFSSKTGGIGEYNSVLIEGVTIALMLIGMTNLVVLMLLLKRKFRQASRVSEVRFLGIILLIVIPLIALALFFGLSLSFGESVRRSIFNVVSVLSTTGYSTVDYAIFPAFAMLIMIFIMFIGGAAGSTSGGLKLGRTYLLFRGAGISISKKLSPENRVDARYFFRSQGKAKIDNALLRDTYAYTFLYFLIFIITALLISITANANLSDSIFEAASLSGAVGISVGILGPSANAATLLVGIIGMIIARLEINIIIMGIYSVFTKR